MQHRRALIDSGYDGKSSLQPKLDANEAFSRELFWYSQFLQESRLAGPARVSQLCIRLRRAEEHMAGAMTAPPRQEFYSMIWTLTSSGWTKK